MGSIVILGGGFAGLNAAIAARRTAGDAADITMVSREPWMTIRPRLYEAAPETLKVDLLEVLEKIGVEFVAAEAYDFDSSARKLLLNSAQPMKFDRLVLATGSVMTRPPVPGGQLPFSIDDRAAAAAFDQHLRRITQEPQLTVAVVGSGFTGIELALEMRDRLAEHGGEQVARNARIVLIDNRPTAGAELGPGLQDVIYDALSSARIELRLNARIVEFTARAVRFADGSSLATDATVLCTGLIASPLTARLPAAKDDRGRLICDQFLRVPQLTDFFAAGDVAKAEAAPGHFTLFSCQHSLLLGKFAGENAARDLLGNPMLPFQQQRYVTCLDLGRSGAVFTEGWDRIIKLTGSDAKTVKRRINTELIYPTRGTTNEILSASQIQAPRRL